MAQIGSSGRPRYSTGRSRRRPTGSGRTMPARPPGARKRGPLPIIIVAALMIAAIFCYIFGRGCGGNREARENDRLRTYASSVNKLIERSSAIAVQFDNLRNGVRDLTRGDASRKLSQMNTDSKEIAESSKKLQVPSKAVRLQPMLQMSLELRAEGVSKFRTGLLDVLDGKDVESSAATMSDGMMDLVISDEVIERYRDGLETRLKAAKSGDLGYVKIARSSPFVPKPGDALLAGVTEYIGELEGESTGEALHGVAVTGVSTSPASQDSTSSGVAILPYARKMTVKVAVQNQGNQEEEDIPVVAVLSLAEGGSPKKETKKIVRLKPNETTTLVFENLKPATGRDTVNVLLMKAGPVKNEKRVDNNEKRLSFIMLAEE